MSQTTAAPKKGNKTTEIIIGTAASKMEAAVKSLLQVAPEISKLQETVNQGTLEVSNLEDKIGGLKQDYTNKVAQNKIEIQQAYDSDAKSFADRWLNTNNMEAIPCDELETIKNELEEATIKVSETVNKAVGAATGSMKKDYDNAIAIQKLEHEKKEANNQAEIVQLKNQVSFLTEQVNHWKTMLDSQVKAETERAKYGQINTLNVGNPQGSR